MSSTRFLGPLGCPLPTSGYLREVFEHRQTRCTASKTQADAVWHGCVGHAARGAAVPTLWLEQARSSLAQTRPAQIRPVALLGVAVLVPIAFVALVSGALLGAACGQLLLPMATTSSSVLREATKEPCQQHNTVVLASERAATVLNRVPNEVWGCIVQNHLGFIEQRRLRQVSSSFFAFGESHAARTWPEKEIITAQASLRQNRREDAAPENYSAQQTYLNDLCEHYLRDVPLQSRSERHHNDEVYRAHENIVGLFASPTIFWSLPAMFPRATRGAGGNTGYVDYLRAGDMSAPIMRGYDRAGGRPFLALRVRQTMAFGQLVAPLVLFQRYRDAGDWRMSTKLLVEHKCFAMGLSPDEPGRLGTNGVRTLLAGETLVLGASGHLQVA